MTVLSDKGEPSHDVVEGASSRDVVHQHRPHSSSKKRLRDGLERELTARIPNLPRHHETTRAKKTKSSCHQKLAQHDLRQLARVGYRSVEKLETVRLMPALTIITNPLGTWIEKNTTKIKIDISGSVPRTAQATEVGGVRELQFKDISDTYAALYDEHYTASSRTAAHARLSADNTAPRAVSASTPGSQKGWKL